MKLPADDLGTPSFPDLANKKIRRVNKPSHLPKTSKSELTGEELGIGTETSTSVLRGVELATDLDEVSVDGLPPPDMAEEIEKEVRTLGTTSPNYLTWWPILDHDGVEFQKPAFVRCDRIFKDDNARRLQNIWAGLIELRFHSIAFCVLVLVRDNITEDTDDNVLMIRLERSNLQEDIEICCRTFAAGTKPKAYATHTLDMIDPKWTMNLRTVLNKLSTPYPSPTHKNPTAQLHPTL